MLRLGRLAQWLAAGATITVCAAFSPAAFGSAGAAAPGGAQTACAGRYLLECSEKLQMFGDDLNWFHGAVLDLEPFETRTSLPLHNHALAQFWGFEAAAAAARAELELELGTEVVDTNFEQLAARATLPNPVVRPAGVIDRGTAAAFSRLMLAEQQEILNLEALDTSLNRATAARYLRGRQDWVAWQEAAAAGFAIHTAAAIGRVITAQQRVSSALTKRHLLFGIGSEDLKLAHRQVRRHGLAAAVVAQMSRLGIASGLIANTKQGFLSTTFGSLSFSLSGFLAAPNVISGERQMIAALEHFATRIPRAGRPPS